MESSRAVLKCLTTEGPATLPQLGALLPLSQPTMSAAMAAILSSLVAERLTASLAEAAGLPV